MKFGWNITTNDIKEWVSKNKRHSEEILPELVEKLVRSSCKPIEISFPSGDSISTGGWDGFLETSYGNEYIPNGKSVWEFGTGEGVNKKASEDYEKRTKDPLGINPNETTFIFVSPHHWRDKKSWCLEKNNEKKWLNVKGINADDLKSWMHQCPAVHRWFAEVIGKITSSVWEINQAWESWINETYIQTNFDIVLNGRESKSQSLVELLNGEPTVLSIISESENESYAFCLATLIKEVSLSSRVIIVKDQIEWDKLSSTQNTLILIPYGFIPINIGYTTKKGHFVLLPESSNNYNETSKNNIYLPRMCREDRINALKSMGFDDETSINIYTNTKGYLSVIRRNSYLKPQEKLIYPEWINLNSNILTTIFFATEWDRKNENDKVVLSNLCGLPYKEFEEKVYSLSFLKDSPIRLVGNVWQVISKVDFFSFIAHKINNNNIENLKLVMFEVLGEYDPSFEIEPAERYLASIKNMTPKYSNRLKLGIASTLAILSIMHSEFTSSIDYWVNELFEKDLSAKGWYSLRNYLQLLAEASPSSFIKSLEKTLKYQSLEIIKLFKDGGSFGGCYHTDLLWALEKLGWSIDFLPRVTGILARLSEIDPGGNYSNRPFGSLAEIFLGWINNTEAKHNQRIEIIDSILIPKYPDIAWKLIIRLIPDSMGQHCIPHSKPTYRNWGEETKLEVSNDKFYEYIEELNKRLISLTLKDLYDKLPKIIEDISKINPPYFFNLLNEILKYDFSSFSDEWRLNVSDMLYSKILDHRRFKDAKWALSEEEINKLEELFDYIKPKDIFNLVKNFIFTEYNPPYIKLIIKDNLDYRERENIIENLRKEKIEEIYYQKGLLDLVEFIKECTLPNLIGLSIYQSNLKDILEKEILSWLNTENENLLCCASAFIYPCANLIEGWAIKIIETSNFNNKAIIKFIQSLPFTKNTFEIIKTLDNNISKEYWKKAEVRYLDRDEIDLINWVIKQFIDNDRPLAALSSASQLLNIENNSSLLDNFLIRDILIKFATIEKNEEEKIIETVSHKIFKAISYLQKEEKLHESEIMQIEWLYVTASEYSPFYPKYLIKEICYNPSFFAELISLAYKPDKEIIESPISDQKIDRAWKLLNRFNILPGIKSDNTLDEDYFKEWVLDVIEELKKLNRSQVIGIQLGKVFFNSPNGLDGIFPHEAVRNFIEELQDESLDNTLKIEIMNSRGVTCKDPYEGGKQEIELANSYNQKSSKLALKYPRLSEIYRSLAKSYQFSAKYEDQRVELAK